MDAARHLGLVDKTLIHLEPAPLDESTPAPWRPDGTSAYSVSGWCQETQAAAEAYAKSLKGVSAYVLAENSEWRGLEWELPEEARTIHTLHRQADTSNSIILPDQTGWELTVAGANEYPNLPDITWDEEQLVVHGWETTSDPRWDDWLAIHPSVARQLRWIAGDEPFSWHGPDGQWRARTILRVRGQLSHQPPIHTYCARVWQVLISETALIELNSKFGHLIRSMQVTRTLPARPHSGHPRSEHSQARASMDGSPSSPG
jgi:hypothetical protein